MERFQITLAAARVNAGFTQDEAAKRLGVNTGTLRNYEKGTAFPDVPMIKKIEDLYQVSYDNLVFLRPDITVKP